MEDIKRSNLRSFRISQMAVRTFGDANVVSFLLNEAGNSAGKSAARDYFIVDVWVKLGDTWKLGSRYRSAATETKQSGTRRPTGKE